MLPEIPPLPKDAPQGIETELAKIRYQAEVDAVLARHQAEIDEIKARLRDEAALEAEERKLAAEDRASEEQYRQAVHQAYLEVGKSMVDRSLTRANFLVGAASAIGTSYAALLALVYNAEGKGSPMPPWGIAPALFLGLSLVLSAAYIGFLQRGTLKGRALPTGVGGNVQEKRLLFFLHWASRGTLRRAWALRMAVTSLGLGVALFPLPFLKVTAFGSWCILGAAAGVLALEGLWEVWSFWKAKTQESSRPVFPPYLTR